jgi:hypothetical protein
MMGWAMGHQIEIETEWLVQNAPLTITPFVHNKK